MTRDELSLAVRSLVGRSATQDATNRTFDRGLWRELGKMGVLGLATQEVGGTGADLCRCILELGAAGIAGDELIARVPAGTRRQRRNSGDTKLGSGGPGPVAEGQAEVG